MLEHRRQPPPGSAPSPLPWVEMGAAKRYRLPAPTPLTGAPDSLAPAERYHGNRVMAQVAMPAEEQRGRPAPRPPPAGLVIGRASISRDDGR